jgi:hypothetical protein
LYFLKILEKHPDKDSFLVNENSIQLNPSAWFRADGIASDFFYLPQ